MSLSLAWNIHELKDRMRDVMLMQARTAYEKDVLYRRWNAGHGGVYAPVTDRTPSNPHLNVPERDITTPSGVRLTLVNPAYMTRQVHEAAREKYGVRGHITSLNPIRPENAPDPWEADALKLFESGSKEVSSVEVVDGAKFIRLMRPLITEKGCLKCHARQGYRLGDIRGGISVAVPMAPFHRLERSQILTRSLAHGLLWFLGLAGIAFMGRNLDRQAATRSLVEEELRTSRRRYQVLTESSGAGIWQTTPEGDTLYVNPAMRHILGIDESIDITGRSCLDFFTPESRERIRQEMATRSQGVRSNYEARIQRPDGEVREVVIYAAPIISDGALNSLIATFMDVTELKRAQIEREELIGVLQATLTKVKLLSGFLPICASCKKIRNDRGYWQQVESYIAEHSEAEFSHGICPDCVRKYYPELNRDDPPESPDTSAEDPEEPDDFTGSRKP